MVTRSRWFTRNRYASGRLADHVDEWRFRPVLIEGKCGGLIWVAPLDINGEEVESAYVAQWPLNEAKQRLRTIPETELECVRYG